MDQDPGNDFDVPLGDLVFAVSSALDLVSPAVTGHHLRVARIARATARQIGFSADQTREILLAAALHDSGAFSLREKLEIMRFEYERTGGHAEAGYRLLKTFPYFESAAQIVRFHHLPWGHGRGETWRGQPVPLGSHLLHLADRVSVLRIDVSGGGWSGEAKREVLAGSGARFVPEIVEALVEAADKPGFWPEVGAAGDAGLRDDPAFGAATLAEPELSALVRLFWQIVDYRSRFTATHTSGVFAVAGFLAPLFGITGASGRKVALAAGLHDLGKLALSSEMLEKEGRLTRKEKETIRAHPLHGWRVLERIPGMEDINRWANFHHERLNGLGYPFRLSAKQIPIESRIVTVADIFTALTEERPYRRGMSGREAVGILRNLAEGGDIDPGVVALMVSNREEAVTVRRLAQDGAAGRYLVFRDHTQDVVTGNTAA